MLWFLEGYLGLFHICHNDYSIHSKLGIFPWFRSYRRKYNIQANKWLTRLKKNDSYSIWCFWSFFHFLHCNVPDKCYKQKCGVLFFTLTKLVVFVLTCAQAMARIKWKRLFMMDVKVSKDKNISRWVDWENLIYVR